MTEQTETSFENKCNILAELWVEYKGQDEFEDFIGYNDIGLPLAYAISVDIVKTSTKAEMFINETFELLLSGLGKNDTGYEDLEELLGLG